MRLLQSRLEEPIVSKTHTYRTTVAWTGDNGTGTSSYRSYERSYDLCTADKPVILGSSDPMFRGDRARWNPEELLVGAISACHQLWFLHLCSEAGISVLAYVDNAEGIMESKADGSSEFVKVMLRPQVTVPPHVTQALLDAIHLASHTKCVLAQSVRFTVDCEGTLLYPEGSDLASADVAA